MRKLFSVTFTEKVAAKVLCSLEHTFSNLFQVHVQILNFCVCFYVDFST